MRPLLVRAFDIYRLKARYRYGMVLFFVGGFITAALLVADAAYPLQIAWGLAPGAPLASEPDSLLFLALLVLCLVVLGLLGMALGALLYCLLLTACTAISFNGALAAIFLSHYPREWFQQ